MRIHAVVEYQTGIFTPAANQKLTVYPNPATGSVWVEIPNGLSNGSVSVIDSRGQSVLSNSPVRGEQRVQLDLSDLPGGIYFIRLNGSAVQAFEKIVVY